MIEHLQWTVEDLWAGLCRSFSGSSQDLCTIPVSSFGSLSFVVTTSALWGFDTTGCSNMGTLDIKEENGTTGEGSLGGGVFLNSFIPLQLDSFI